MHPSSPSPALLTILLIIATALHPLPPSLSATATAANYAADANWVQDSGTSSVSTYDSIISFSPLLYSTFVPESHAQCVARLTPRGKPLIDITRECCIANLTFTGASDIRAGEICCRLIRELPQFRSSVFNDPTPACVTEVCAFDAFIEAIVVQFQQKFVDEALPEAMLQADTIFNALTSLDGVLAAKLQEASLAAQALVEKESREQGIQLQFAPYARRAAPDFLRRVREQLEADYSDTSERKIAADLKYRLLFITVQYLGYPYDVVAEFNLRQTYATAWRQRLLRPYTLPPNSMPIFQEDPFKMPAVSSLDEFKRRTNARQSLSQLAMDIRAETQRRMCRELSTDRPPEYTYSDMKSVAKTHIDLLLIKKVDAFERELQQWRSHFLHEKKLLLQWQRCTRDRKSVV